MLEYSGRAICALISILISLDGSDEINHESEGRLAGVAQQAQNLRAIADQFDVGTDYDKVGFGEWIIRTGPRA